MELVVTGIVKSRHMPVNKIATATYREITSLATLQRKLKGGQDLTFEDLAFLVNEIIRISENDIPHLKACIRELELERKRSAKSVLLGLTLMLWALTPIAFLSIPLIGIVCGLTAMFSTWCYIKARTYVL
ncbi:MAG: hypothetical protein MRT15_12435 [archaeon YNP-LCB-003-016]|uniref:hypothetical protein n=1 Tax=Candidatus Culexarchaeum yellowstonense TaxID=2928963 RepID=UPI0026EBC7FE|nr:hypothetical protein [Candidatus Culexarchaeum yellowstonense]MCR6693195.1 hypothetical protein [Candidatus Culexarchaeum yellowstonense]